MQILWQKKVICRTISTLFMKGTENTNVNLVANHLLLTRGYSFYIKALMQFMRVKQISNADLMINLFTSKNNNQIQWQCAQQWLFTDIQVVTFLYTVAFHRLALNRRGNILGGIIGIHRLYIQWYTQTYTCQYMQRYMHQYTQGYILACIHALIHASVCTAACNEVQVNQPIKDSLNQYYVYYLVINHMLTKIFAA